MLMKMSGESAEFSKSCVSNVWRLHVALAAVVVGVAAVVMKN